MRWCRRLFRRARIERQLDAELRFHLDEQIADYIAAGMAPEEARRRARLGFGGLEQVKEECRDIGAARFVETLAQDARYGLRQLRRNPGFTAVAVITLALGIGANTGIFSLVDAVLLKTLPVRDPQRLVTIRLPDPHGGYDGIPYTTFEYLRAHNSVLSGIFASSIPEHLDITIRGSAELVSGQVVSGGYYSTLGVHAILGRTIAPRDDAPGAPPVAVISYGYWKRRFGGSPDVISKSIEINGSPFTIVGVTPPGFFGLMAGFSPEVTASINMQPLLMGDGTLPNNRGTWSVEMVGARLKPDVALEQARADLGLLFSQTLRTAEERKKTRIEVAPGSRGLPVIRKHFAAPLVVLMVVVGLVLLIACANVANLLLARATVRRKEMAMRLALGAGCARLVRQLLCESVLLSTLGGAVGLSFAVWVTHFLLAVISSAGLPISLSAPLDLRVLGFTALVAIGTGVLFGFVPAIRATQINLTPDLNAGPGVGAGTRCKPGLGNTLVVAQIAASLILMVGVGLFVRTLWALQDLYPGFTAEHVLLFTVEPHLVGYKGARLTNLYRELLESIQGLPGVRSVSASRFAPLTPAGADASISITGHVPRPDEDRTVQESIVAPHFFRAMGMRLLFGRHFTFQDAEGRPRVAVINQDLRYGLRQLRRNPGFTTIGIITLALGIGATTAIFSVVNGVLLKPLPYPHADRLVDVAQTTPGFVFQNTSMTPAAYFIYREQSRTFEDIGIYRSGAANVTGSGPPERLSAVDVTDGLLPILGISPLLGRWFTRADDEPGSPDTVMLTYGYWRRKFGGNRPVLGKTLDVYGKPRTIIGVMPKRFRFLDMTNLALLLPIKLNRAKTYLGDFSYGGIARLKRGVTLAEANADVARMIPLALRSFPPYPGYSLELYQHLRLRPNLRPLKLVVVGNVSRILWVLMGGISLVLLIACANVANLLLVRVDGRRQELAIRAALGASPRRIAGDLWLESLTLAPMSGALGLAFAYGALHILVAMAPSGLPRLNEIRIDGPVLLFTLGIAVTASLLFGSIPVLKYAGTRLGIGLREAGHSLSPSRERHRARNTLVVAQVGLSLVLLASSGLMIRTFWALIHVQPGFAAPGEVQTFHVYIPEVAFKAPEQVVRIEHAILAKIESLPASLRLVSAGLCPWTGTSRKIPYT